MALTRARKLIYWAISVFGLMLVAQLGCHILLWTSLTRIEEVLEKPASFPAQTQIAGNIETAWSLPFTGSVYKMRDSTGTLWVMSKDDSVEDDRFVVVTGYVKETLTVDDSGKWKPFLKMVKEEHLQEISNPGPVLVEKRRESIARALWSILWK
ncbi:MAG: hypothetical protein HYU36_24640 [Planctomycetes bacterium]|nr:hypothetical protein [Planctomycetota bacterium]